MFLKLFSRAILFEIEKNLQFSTLEKQIIAVIFLIFDNMNKVV